MRMMDGGRRFLAAAELVTVAAVGAACSSTPEPDLEYFEFGPGIGGQYAVIAPDRSSGIFFAVSDGEVTSITVTWGDSSFMDLCNA